MDSGRITLIVTVVLSQDWGVDGLVQADHPKQCSLHLANYMECLHHRKEVHGQLSGVDGRKRA
jgi:hypothetical protein